MRQFYFLLTFFLFFFSENIQAQLVNGTKSLGGYASFSASKYKALQQPNSNYSNQSLSLGISPSYAYFKNNFLLGASISNGLNNFKSNSENATSNIDYKSTDYYFNINPFGPLKI